MRADGSATESTTVLILRTADGLATVRAAGRAARTDAPPALPIDLDALAEWGFRLEDTGEDARLRVAYERPRFFESATPTPGVDVAVTSVRGYSVSYAAANRVRLEPATAEMRAYAGGEDDFVYREVTFDPATHLPTRVVLTAPSETLTLEYVATNGGWCLRHVLDEDRSRTRDRHAIRTLEATYDDVEAPPASTSPRASSPSPGVGP